MKQNTQNQPTPESATLNTWIEGKPFVISGDYEAVADQLPRADAYVATLQAEAPKVVQAPAAPVVAPNQYIDYSELGSRQMARMKLRAQVYDLFHRTQMYGKVVDKLNEDRDIAFARGLGLISTTHCLKHEKAVAKLRQLV